MNEEVNSSRKVLYEMVSCEKGQFLVRGTPVGANVEELEEE